MATAHHSGYVQATLRIGVDDDMIASEGMTTPAGPGFSLKTDCGGATIWIDWEAIPRLCHLLTELYARRPQPQMSDDEAVAMFLREDR